MFIFQNSGRLGNQIFQYVALRTLCDPQEQLVLLGFEDLQSIFEGIDAKVINLSSPKIERAFYRRLYRVADYLSRKNILCQIFEYDEGGRVAEYNTTGQIYEHNKAFEHLLTRTPGLLNSIKFVRKSYFQSESAFQKSVVNSLLFKDSILSLTQSTLSSFPKSCTYIFVHIRRGDYLLWPSRNNPAVLSIDYYKKCIDIINSQVSNPFFLFASDDPYYVEDVFADLKNIYISRGSSCEDFALMSHCHGGILSASSFSWWTAYFAKSRHPNAIFLAPKYWGGHRIKAWIPSTIESTFLTYVDT
jgi:hypothetical protein